MEKQKITETQINMIQNDSFDANFWYYHLGISISEEDLSTDNLFSFDFYNSGREYWDKLKDKLMTILCDRDNKVPHSTMDEVLNGDIRNLAVYLVTVLVTDLGIVINVAIPLAALILKKGLKEFCLIS